MNFCYDIENVVDYNLTFTVKSGEIQWYLDGIKKSNDFINEDLKNLLPKKKIFKINSLIYNIETQNNNVNISLNCSYNNENNSLSIIVNENIIYIPLLQEMMTIGFRSEKSVRSTSIKGDAYKILYVETKDMLNNIKEYKL